MAKKGSSNKENPIGIFDSGVGGLTVAKAITDLLPNENIIYFGDTAHMPYGEKSAHAIQSYAEKITEFLLSKSCKLIVIACNSASVSAFKQVKERLPNGVVVINVIDPVIEHVSNVLKFKKIGLIGTKRTVSSAVYKKKFEKANKKLLVKSLATPLLAPMIEEGFFNNKISKTVVHSYLSNPHLLGIEAIILACTHYPLIIGEIQSYYKKQINIINSAEIVSQSVQNFLAENDLLNNQDKKAKHQFFVSDYTKSFEETARIFYGKKLELKENNLF